MSDKTFTQICKAILALGERLDGLNNSADATSQRISEAKTELQRINSEINQIFTEFNEEKNELDSTASELKTRADEVAKAKAVIDQISNNLNSFASQKEQALNELNSQSQQAAQAAQSANKNIEEIRNGLEPKLLKFENAYDKIISAEQSADEAKTAALKSKNSADEIKQKAQELNDLLSELKQLKQNLNIVLSNNSAINDTSPSATTTYSSQKIEELNTQKASTDELNSTKQALQTKINEKASEIKTEISSKIATIKTSLNAEISKKASSDELNSAKQELEKKIDKKTTSEYVDNKAQELSTQISQQIQTAKEDLEEQIGLKADNSALTETKDSLDASIRLKADMSEVEEVKQSLIAIKNKKRKSVSIYKNSVTTYGFFLKVWDDESSSLVFVPYALSIPTHSLLKQQLYFSPIEPSNSEVNLSYQYKNVKDIFGAESAFFILTNDNKLFFLGQMRSTTFFQTSLGSHFWKRTNKPLLTNVKNVFLMHSSSDEGCGGVFVVKNDGSVWVAGLGDGYGLGTGNTANQYEFVEAKELTKLSSISPIKKIESLASLGYTWATTIILLENGDVYGVGCNHQRILDTKSKSISRVTKLAVSKIKDICFSNYFKRASVEPDTALMMLCEDKTISCLGGVQYLIRGGSTTTTPQKATDENGNVLTGVIDMAGFGARQRGHGAFVIREGFNDVSFAGYGLKLGDESVLTSNGFKTTGIFSRANYLEEDAKPIKILKNLSCRILLEEYSVIFVYYSQSTQNTTLVFVNNNSTALPYKIGSSTYDPNQSTQNLREQCFLKTKDKSEAEQVALGFNFVVNCVNDEKNPIFKNNVLINSIYTTTKVNLSCVL